MVHEFMSHDCLKVKILETQSFDSQLRPRVFIKELAPTEVVERDKDTRRTWVETNSRNRFRAISEVNGKNNACPGGN